MAREYDLAWQDPRRHGRKEERKAELTSEYLNICISEHLNIFEYLCHGIYSVSHIINIIIQYSYIANSTSYIILQKLIAFFLRNIVLLLLG